MKENEKVANRKFGKVGNLGNLRKIIPNFLISKFSNSDLKISKKNFRNFRGFRVFDLANFGQVEISS